MRSKPWAWASAPIATSPSRLIVCARIAGTIAAVRCAQSMKSKHFVALRAMIWIAVDAMGGDHGPRHVVDGALAAVRHFDLGVILVGRLAALEPEVERLPMSTHRA